MNNFRIFILANNCSHTKRKVAQTNCYKLKRKSQLHLSTILILKVSLRARYIPGFIRNIEMKKVTHEMLNDETSFDDRGHRL